MKLEQAFYTWGKDQMTFAKEGLGICAASRTDSTFLQKGLALGSRFNSEGLERTAEFVLYSPDFGDYVAVGISPRDGGGDKRTNKLCHFYIPAEQRQAPEPAEYLLEYSYSRSVMIGATLPQCEIKQASYSYYDILARYSYDNSNPGNKRRLAKLLSKAYPCAFGEEQNVFFIIDRGWHPNEDEDARIAREITWLLSTLMPRPEGEEDLYRRRMSYGVYTVANTNAVQLIFTDRLSLGENKIFLDMPVDDNEEIPAVYEIMAEKAQSSLEEFQEFMSALLKRQYMQELKSDQLSKLYLRWKMDVGMQVSKEEAEAELLVIVRTMGRSAWHKQFLVDYLAQIDGLSMDEIIDYWEDYVRPFLKKHAELKETEQLAIEKVTFRFLCEMFNMERGNYHIMIRNIPETLRKKILSGMRKMQDSPIEIEYREMDSSKTLKEFIERYHFFNEEEEFTRSVGYCAERLYERAESNECCEITAIMIERDKQAWESYLYRRCENVSTITQFVQWFSDEIEKVKLDSLAVSCYCEKLLEMIKLESEVSDSEMTTVCDFISGVTLNEYYQRQFSELIDEWRERKEVTEIAKADLEELVKRKPSKLTYSGRKKWIEVACNRMKRRGSNISEDIFNGLLQCMLDVYRCQIQTYAEKYVKEYVQYLWDSALSAGNFEERIRRGVKFQITQEVIKREHSQNIKLNYSVWKELIRYERYPELKRVLEDPELEAFLHDRISRGESQCVFFEIWNCVQDGEKLIGKEFPKGTDAEDVRELFRKLEKQILDKGEQCSDIDVYNYLFLQVWTEFLFEYGKGDSFDFKKKKQKKFRKIKENAGFADTVLRKNIIEGNKNVKRRWEELKEYLQPEEYRNITVENVERYLHNTKSNNNPERSYVPQTKKMQELKQSPKKGEFREYEKAFMEKSHE